MSHHSIIELNHDHAHKFKDDPNFGRNLYGILANLWSKNIKKDLLQKYGITILSQHHSSQRHELVMADKGEEHYTEADYQTWMKR